METHRNRELENVFAQNLIFFSPIAVVPTPTIEIIAYTTSIQEESESPSERQQRVAARPARAAPRVRYPRPRVPRLLSARLPLRKPLGAGGID